MPRSQRTGRELETIANGLYPNTQAPRTVPMKEKGKQFVTMLNRVSTKRSCIVLLATHVSVRSEPSLNTSSIMGTPSSTNKTNNPNGTDDGYRKGRRVANDYLHAYKTPARGRRQDTVLTRSRWAGFLVIIDSGVSSRQGHGSFWSPDDSGFIVVGE